MSQILNALEKAEAPLFIVHRHADRDSLGAALGLQQSLGKGTVFIPDGIAGPAQGLPDAVGVEPVTDRTTVEYDAEVVLDAPSAERIAPVDPAEPILIDHHEPADLNECARASLVDTDSGATAALVARLVEKGNWDIPPDAALPLLVGILDDTGFLAAAPAQTVEVATQLASNLGERAEDLPALIDRTPAKGERIARALGTLRARGYRTGEYTVAVSQVGGYEGAAASALRNSDIDLVAVCSQQGDELRVTVRASDTIADSISVGAGLLPAMAAHFGGDGGGHSCAGVAHLSMTSVDDAEQYLIDYLEDELGVTFGEVG